MIFYSLNLFYDDIILFTLSLEHTKGWSQIAPKIVQHEIPELINCFIFKVILLKESLDSEGKCCSKVITLNEVILIYIQFLIF